LDVRFKKVCIYVILTFILSWSTVALFIMLGGGWNTPASIAFAIVYMYFPMVASIIVQRIIFGESLKELLGASPKLNSWFLVAWLLPPILHAHPSG